MRKRSPKRNEDEKDFMEIVGKLPFVKENDLEEEENFGDIERSFQSFTNKLKILEEEWKHNDMSVIQITNCLG